MMLLAAIVFIIVGPNCNPVPAHNYGAPIPTTFTAGAITATTSMTLGTVQQATPSGTYTNWQYNGSTFGWVQSAASFAGDGSDGVAIFDGTSTPTGSTKSSSILYFLNRDVYYSSVTISSGVEVQMQTAAFGTGVSVRMFVQGQLNNQGTLDANGQFAPVGGVAGKGFGLGSGTSFGTAGGGTNGGSGTTGTGAAGIVSGSTFLGAVGGHGGGGSSTGSVAGALTAPATATLPRTCSQLCSGMVFDGSNFANIYSGGTGGGGGGGDGTNSGGGGGGGGGTAIICAQTVTGNGAYSANGGRGGNGAVAGNTGGGGGGGGGVLAICSHVNTIAGSGGTTTATGGGVGNNHGTGGTGQTAGTNGTVIQVTD